jgi:hypothetical protein
MRNRIFSLVFRTNTKNTREERERKKNQLGEIENVKVLHDFADIYIYIYILFPSLQLSFLNVVSYSQALVKRYSR